MARHFIVRFVLLTVVVSGCGSGVEDRYQRYPVRGTVQLNGVPLVRGSIVFYPAVQGPVVAGTTVQDGRFQIAAAQGLPVGHYKVSVTATDDATAVGASPEQLMENPPEVRSLVPSKYNTETTLSFEVTATADNVCDLILTAE